MTTLKDKILALPLPRHIGEVRTGGLTTENAYTADQLRDLLRAAAELVGDEGEKPMADIPIGYANLETLDFAISFYQNKVPDNYFPVFLGKSVTKKPAFDWTDAEIDVHLDAILRGSGSALRHYSMQYTLNKMRGALRAALAATPTTEQSQTALGEQKPVARGDNLSDLDDDPFARKWIDREDDTQPAHGEPRSVADKLREACDPEDFGVPAQWAKQALNYAEWFSAQRGEQKPCADCGFADCRCTNAYGIKGEQKPVAEPLGFIAARTNVFFTAAMFAATPRNQALLDSGEVIRVYAEPPAASDCRKYCQLEADFIERQNADDSARIKHLTHERDLALAANRGEGKLREALEALYNAIDSCVDLTPEIMSNARAALAIDQEKRG